MRRPRTAGRWWPLLGLMAALPACAMAVQKPEAPNPEPETPQSKLEAPSPPLTPEEQAALDLLERSRAESKIKREHDQLRAEQHLKAGKAHFENQAWKAAHDQFKMAVELDPANKEAQDCLRRAASLLGVVGVRAEPGGFIDAVLVQEKVRREAERVQLLSLLADARAAYEKGQFEKALELYIRVKALGKYLGPYLDAAKTVEEAGQGIGNAQKAIEQGGSKREEERRRRALEESERLRKQGQSLLIERQEAQLAQARALFAERRYSQARRLCDEVLRHDPANGSASTLRDGALQAARAEAVDRALRARAAETERWGQELSALTVPQNDILSVSPQRLNELRERKGDPLFGPGLPQPEAWEARIREALERKVTFDFIETPLADVVSFLGSLTDASMVLDTEAVKGNMPNVSLRVQEMRLGAALNWLCKLVGLSYVLRDEAIFISRPERIFTTPVLRMYDITDLTIEIKNFKGRQRALATDTGQSPGDFFRDEEKEEEENEKPLSGKELVDFLKRIVAPTGPDDDGGMDRLREVAGLPRDSKPGKGQELVDLIGVTVGGRTFLGVKTKE